MENKHNFTGIIIPVIVAVILLTVLPIINSINSECPPCEECPICEDKPTLYTPTISISGVTLTITPNLNNGAFVTGYKIYVDDVLLDTTTSTTYDLSEELTEVGTYEIYVTAYATLFIDSEPSNIEEYVIEPVPTEPILFEVGQVLPQTTQLRIHFNASGSIKLDKGQGLKSDNNNYQFFILNMEDYTFYFNSESPIPIMNFQSSTWEPPFNVTDHNYIDIDTSSWTLSKRTISSVGDCEFTWEDLNA